MEVLIKESEKSEDEKTLTSIWKDSKESAAVAKQVESQLDTDTKSNQNEEVTEKFLVNRLWQFLYLARRNIMNLIRDPRYEIR